MTSLQVASAQPDIPVGTESNASLRSVVEALFRQRKVFLWSFALTMTLALLWIYATPRKYGSEMSLLVQNARGNDVITADRTTGAPIVSDVTPEQLNSEVEVLQSNDVLDDVVDPGWTKVPTSKRSPDELNRHQAAVSYLAKHLEITPAKKSHVIDVELTAHDPERATTLMSRLLAVFLAKQRTLNRPAGTTKFFAGEVARYKAEWEAAQSKLNAFQEAHGVVSPHDKEAALQQEILDLDTQMRTSDVQVSEIQHRIQGDIGELKAAPARESTLVRKMPDAGYIDQLNALLVQLKNQRTELLTKYVPTDRLVKQVDDQIASTTQALDRARQGTFDEASTNVNPTWQAADENLSQQRAELKAMQARRSGLVLQLNQLRQQLNATEADELQFKALQHDASEAEENYQTNLQKRDAAQVSDAMDAQQFLNVGVVEAPTFSLTPVHPRPLRDTLLGIFSSLFVGAFAVFLAESSRQTYATAHELELGSGFPVLATIPLGPALPEGMSDTLPPAARVSILQAVGRRKPSSRRSGFLRQWRKSAQSI
jgi:uncharacterized protein involved in exopolysaccharide biosynthesis